MTAREPHIPDGYTAECREYRAKVHEMLDTEDKGLSDWEIEFLDAMLKRTTYTTKMMDKIDQIYETKM